MTPPAPVPRPSRPGVSRLPRGVTVLGLVLVLGEVIAAATLLASGPNRGTGSHRGTAARPSQPAHGPSQAAHGPAQTVVLRVDGVPLPHPTCIALPQAPCGPEIAYGTDLRHFTSVPMPARLPFVKTIRVEAGQSVRLNADSDTHARITCSITVDGRILSKATAFTPSKDFTEHGNASCHSTIPGSGTDPSAVRQTAVLRVDAVPGSACQPTARCSPGVDYTSSAGDAMTSVTLPFIAEVPEPAGGAVTLNAIDPGELVTCSITENGRILSQATRKTAGGETTCYATIQ